VDLTFRLIAHFYPAFASWPAWLIITICVLIPAGVVIGAMSAGPLLYVYAERKISGFMQDRLGPMRVGPYGLLQTLADTIKLLMKEAIFPRNVDKTLFLAGPCLVITGAFMSLLVIPFSSRLQVVDLNIGLLYIVAISSLSTVGLIMAGWASNNKYALFGAMRSAAQIVSYEIPEVLILMTVVMMAGTLSVQELSFAQGGGFTSWFVFRYFPLMPLAFLAFFVAGMAECNRTPFDIPEAESELVAGFHTEYSGFFFAMFFLAEYTEMFVISAVASILFLGGWMAPFPAWQSLAAFGLPQLGLGAFWLVAKAWTLMLVMMWLRWTLPRLRVDQLMHMAWKVLLPFALALAVIVGALIVYEPTRYGFPVWDTIGAWITAAAIPLYLLYVMVKALRWRAQRMRGLA
jgi:NADH-quinone oxidoreductase subunit H